MKFKLSKILFATTVLSLTFCINSFAQPQSIGNFNFKKNGEIKSSIYSSDFNILYNKITNIENYVQEGKVNLINSLNAIGANLNQDSTFEQISEGILKSQKIKDENVAVNENNLPNNYSCWVNGQYIVGNGTDLKNTYNQGYSDGYNEGANSAQETIILYFGGIEILASDKEWGGSGGAWMSSVTRSAKGLVVENIDPKIFQTVRYSGTWSYGSASGNYLNQNSVSGYYHINFVDKVTGEIIKTTGSGDVTVDLSLFSNPVDMYIDATITNNSYGDPYVICTLGNVYLKVRDDYQG